MGGKPFFWFGLFFWCASCAPTPSPIVDQDSKVERTQSMIVMGIQWVENYNNPESKEIELLHSAFLLKNTAKIRKHKVAVGSPRLYDPLHYISNLRFILESSDKKQQIRRFDKDLRGYEEIAIHQLEPGNYDWNDIRMTYLVFRPSGPNHEKEKWHPQQVYYPAKYGQWKIKAGDIVYLGDVTFFFQTKKFSFGLFFSEIVNQSIQLTRVRFQDHFEKMKQKLRQEKPWFPVDSMVNQAIPKEWEMVDRELIPREANYFEKKTQEKQNQDKYFF